MSFDDDFPLDEATGAAVADALTTSSETAAMMVREHREDNDEILSTVLLGAVGRWYSSAVSGEDKLDASDALRASQVLADLYADGDNEMETAIATGFLEALPHPHEQGREVVDRLPTVLREELRRMEEWRPTT